MTKTAPDTEGIAGIDLLDLIREVMILRSEGDLTFKDLIDNDLTVEEKAALWLYATELKTSAALLERVFNEEVGRELEARGHGLELGDYTIFYSVKKDEKCVDTAAFHGWLRTQPADLVEKLFNPNTVRVGQLPPAARSTFYEKTERPNAEKQVVAAPSAKVEEARIRRERDG